MKDGAHVLTEATKDLTPEKIISAMVGRDMAGEAGTNGSGARERAAGQAALVVNHLTAADRIYDINFEARYGEVLGITGVIGSGKTELARALFGADRVDSGEIYVNGKRVQHKHPLEALNNGIGMLPEDRKTQGLLLEQEVYKNITLCDLQKNNRRLLNRSFEYNQARKMVKALNIKISGLDHQVMFLSGGNQQKVVLAKWLLADPDIIILDEPTRGIDVGAKGEIYKIMKDLARQGKCIIFISSEVPEIITVADRVLLMKKGRITDRYENGVESKELFHAMLEDKK
jgi:ribose transport system ATP-binding protein